MSNESIQAKGLFGGQTLSQVIEEEAEMGYSNSSPSLLVNSKDNIRV